MLHLVGCLYYWYQWCTVKQISENEIYLLIKYIKSVLWRVVKRLSYIEEARYLKVKEQSYTQNEPIICFCGLALYYLLTAWNVKTVVFMLHRCALTRNQSVLTEVPFFFIADAKFQLTFTLHRNAHSSYGVIIVVFEVY